MHIYLEISHHTITFGAFFIYLSPPCVNDTKDQTQHVIDYVDGIGENSLQSGGMEYGSKANGFMWSSFEFFKIQE
jgi:hypothetical protein